MADYLNASLIGVPGSRWQLQTPALVVDLDILERNIAKMAEHAKAHGISLRPHAKTHKSVEIAKRQLAAGALGQCCAKLGEAEALAAGGIDGILLTSPVVTTGGIARLMALNSRMTNLMATCDNLEIAKRLNAAATAAGKPLQVVVDIDPGMSRTGIRPDGGAVELVEFVAQAEGLKLAGLQCYAGQAQHMESPNERRSASLGVMADFGKLRDTLKARGITPPLMSGGGTGTFDIDVDAKVLTELQVGSYVFMDRQYNDVWEKPGERTPFETSLFVHTSVISANRDGLATTDAGLKAFATDAEPPRIAAGPRDGKKLTHGDQLACVVPHCDPTVNLYDCYHAVRGDTLEAIWPVDARGRSA
jgi:D-serine deaminase-like pyridoxal phosphate-dependent protein